MVQADAVADEPLQVLADRRIEPEPTYLGAHSSLLVLGEHVEAAKVLGLLGGGLLGEVDDVDGRTVGVDQFGDRFVERGLAVFEGKRHRSDRAGHGHCRAAGAPGQVLGEAGRRAEGGRHEQELGIGQLQQGNLPCPSPLGVAVEVELVGHHEAERAVGPFPEGLVGEDLGGGADDRGTRVDRGVAGDHADVFGAEVAGQSEELLAD